MVLRYLCFDGREYAIEAGTTCTRQQRLVVLTVRLCPSCPRDQSGRLPGDLQKGCQWEHATPGPVHVQTGRSLLSEEGTSLFRSSVGLPVLSVSTLRSQVRT